MEKENLEGTRRGGQWKWYFSTGIDPKAVTELQKAREEGKRNLKTL